MSLLEAGLQEQMVRLLQNILDELELQRAILERISGERLR